jgi:hypothetical protein
LAVLHSVVTITKAPFITTLAHTILVWGSDHKLQGEQTLWVCI